MMTFHSDRFTVPLPHGHRFPMTKYTRLRSRVEVVGGPWRLVEAPAATDEELSLVHSADYLSAVAQGRLDAALQREIGFPWSPALVERSRRSVGATLGAAHGARVEGVAVSLAGGTHHARADRGSGYCVFNDVAVAARVVQARARCEQAVELRILVVDLDVHQGDGTAAIFRDDDSVFTLSMHAERNFPFRKERSDLDVGLPDGCGDEEYLAVLERALDETWRRHGDDVPALAFYIAGADAHEHDRLGRLKLSSAGLAERDRRVFAALRARRIPVAVSMGGGYGQDVDETVAIHLRTLQEAAASWALWRQDAERLPPGNGRIAG
jgi:acetoin utilization deacetylase AcuC-like enzyme